ncbi:MAG TPA: uridine kinase [Chloroflexota bacterium]|nr:uridine kinase [Chloroflexota bacterium]
MADAFPREVNTAEQVNHGPVSGAKHIASRLMAESLMNRQVLQQTDAQPVMQLLPDTNVIKIGGQSILDRGRSALLPVVEELGANLAQHKMIISVGEGTRARHAYDIATDLGLPTGVLSVMGDVISNQNALIVTTIMMRYGAVRVPEDHFDMFPIFLNSGCPIVICGMAPYRWWEQPPEIGRVPEHRSDAGTFLTAEVFGCRSAIFVKDVDGLYTDDPKVAPEAELIPRIGVGELLARKPRDLPIEPSVLHMMARARHMKEIRIVNGLVPGTITRALNGESVGTTIFAD